jgi:hypothetical protein
LWKGGEGELIPTSLLEPRPNQKGIKPQGGYLKASSPPPKVVRRKGSPETFQRKFSEDVDIDRVHLVDFASNQNKLRVARLL